jgi:hypothetical protein
MKKLLVKALINVFDMDNNDARAIAQQIEDVFHGKEEIEDMDIDKYTRSLFYELQREKLLKLRREEIKEKGKPVRKFFWSFNTKAIKDGAYQKPIEEEAYEIYNKIPRHAWLAQTTYNT